MSCLYQIAAVLLIGIVPGDGQGTVATVQQRVDLIELNHFVDDEGREVFRQVIFYDWSDEHHRFHVRAWRLIKQDSQLPNRRWNPQRYQCTWHDDGLLRQVWGAKIARNLVAARSGTGQSCDASRGPTTTLISAQSCRSGSTTCPLRLCTRESIWQIRSFAEVIAVHVPKFHRCTCVCGQATLRKRGVRHLRRSIRPPPRHRIRADPVSTGS